MDSLEPVTVSSVEVGMQVVYIPNHVVQMTKYSGDPIVANGTEYGFVTSYSPKTVFCRFYYRNGTGLRTVSNSESVAYENLFVLPENLRVPQEEVDAFVRANYNYIGRKTGA